VLLEKNLSVTMPSPLFINTHQSLLSHLKYLSSHPIFLAFSLRIVLNFPSLYRNLSLSSPALKGESSDRISTLRL
jgi:hypothetical protein